MRVAFFGQTGPYAPEALRHLLASARGAYELVLVVEGLSRGGPGRTHRMVEPRRAAPPKGDHLAAIAAAAGVPTLATRDVNDRWAVQELLRQRLDAMVCVGFDRLGSFRLSRANLLD